MMQAILGFVKDLGFRLVSYGGGSVVGEAVVQRGTHKYKIVVTEVV